MTKDKFVFDCLDENLFVGILCKGYLTSLLTNNIKYNKIFVYYNYTRPMIIPDKLPIMRIEDYHTHYLGHISNGQLFWGYQTFAFTKPFSDLEQSDDWEKYKKEYVVVHTFEKDGSYLTTNYWYSLTIDTNEKQLEDKLQEMVSELGDIDFQDIEIKIFQIQIDNVTFGLVADQESEMINLQPSSTISFQEPWDGEYYT